MESASPDHHDSCRLGQGLALPLLVLLLVLLLMPMAAALAFHPVRAAFQTLPLLNVARLDPIRERTLPQFSRRGKRS